VGGKGRRVSIQDNKFSRHYHKESCLDAITCGEAWVMIMQIEQLSLPQIRIYWELKSKAGKKDAKMSHKIVLSKGKGWPHTLREQKTPKLLLKWHTE